MLSAEEYLLAPPREIWNLPIEHWSPSSLSMLQRCPYQWQQRYLLGRRQRPAEAPVTGSAVHAGIEHNFGQKISSGVDLPIVDLLDWYMDTGFPTTVLDQEERGGGEILWDTDPEHARTRGRAMLAEYHGIVAPRIQPLAVETKISADFGLAVPVEGRFDVTRSESVIDVKTGKAVVKKPKEDWRIQAAVYSHAEGKPTEFHSVAASLKTNAVTIATPLDYAELLVDPPVEEREEMARSIRSLSAWACLLMSVYGRDEPWPTLGRFHSWACDYCGFRAGCPAWKET